MPKLHRTNQRPAVKVMPTRKPMVADDIKVKSSDVLKESIVTLLEQGPATKAELAYVLDRKPASLHVYLDQLASQGVIAAERRGRGATWALAA